MPAETRSFAVDRSGRATIDGGCLLCDQAPTCELDHVVSQVDRGGTVLGLLLLGGLGAGFTASDSVTVTLPFCDEHGDAASAALRRNAQITAGAVLLALAIVLTAAGIGLWTMQWKPWLFGGVAAGIATAGTLEVVRRMMLRRAGLFFTIEKKLGRKRLKHYPRT